MNHTLVRPDFPTVIDNTMRATYVSCPKQLYWRFLRHLQSNSISVHLHAGGAFAKSMEVTRREFYDNGCPPDIAMGRGLKALMQYWGDYEPPEEHGQKPVKTFERMCGALEYYFANYPLEFDRITPVRTPTGGAIEFNFILPLDVKHPVTGDPILYSGRFDMLGQRDSGIFVVDEKTTKQLGESWRSQWKLRSQMTGYVWGSRKFGYDTQGFIIRGISILKDSYGTIEALGYRPQWHLDMWEEQLHRDIKRMIANWEEGYFDYAFNDACSSYGGCMFGGLCDSPTPEAWTSEFKVLQWDPTRVF